MLGEKVSFDGEKRYDNVVSSCPIDPDGVDRRKTMRRLKRQRYATPGPNFLWHVDGWDKLAPFSIFIHGAVDGFSRRILYSWKSTQLTRTRESLLRTTSTLSNNLEVYREGYVVIKAQRM